ncbi:MAG: DUF2384 domain-containing protein [Gemmatimonadetes bacterium]|jgi:putative toxin-antitoxin system antitoxin component (TIGR02293 family)|nr:DUF2384 domain-containing protein [Gemmatimonadota bacterium]
MTSLEFPAVSHILGGEEILQCNLDDYFDFIELSDRGLPTQALAHLAEYLQLSLSQIARLLPVSERTLQRHKGSKPFNRLVSEQILHIAEVTARGTEVFGEREKFLCWLKQPSTALAGKTPLELLGSHFGAEMVLDELGRMEHGVFS